MIASVVVLWLLHVKYNAIHWLSAISVTGRTIAASSVMGIGVWILEYVLRPASGLSQMAELFLCITGGILLYVISLYALRVPEIRNLSSLLPKRNTDVETTL
jgi:hypothetical protein